MALCVPPQPQPASPHEVVSTLSTSAVVRADLICTGGDQINFMKASNNILNNKTCKPLRVTRPRTWLIAGV